MATPTNPAAALTDVREDIISIEAGIQAATDAIPESNSIISNRPAVTGLLVQIRADQEYLALRQSDLRRLERTQRSRARAA